ncbi:hypothetical protein [Tenacibaculum sp.]|uniref:hypothetical protein n=1 Tax=Tenacibaculum sp. TaxID=1906242 RepID=UPI003D13E312
MKKQNSIDLIVENLLKEFSKIKDFELTQNDPMGNKFFNFVVRLVSEFRAYQNLFIQYYLPASRNSINETKREIKHSKYKDFFHITEEEFKENYYETIRLGYVGAYHKYEGYIKRLLPLMDEFFKDLDFENEFIPLENYLKNEFGIVLKKTVNNFHITKKINWISNCVKHYDGFPIKEPIPKEFEYLSKEKKIQIESKEFKSDMESLITHNNLMLSTFFLIGFHQFFGYEFSSIKDQLKPENQEEVKAIKMQKDLKFVIEGMFGNKVST